MTMETVIILSRKVHNPLRANDHHAMPTARTVHTFQISYQARSSLAANGYQSTNKQTNKHWCSELFFGIYCRVKLLSTDVSEVRTVSIIRETSVDKHFTRQYIPEDNSEHHTRRRENLKSHEQTLLVVSLYRWPEWNWTLTLKNVLKYHN
jgi:hypothetical protein